MSFNTITEGFKAIEELFFPSVCYLCGNIIPDDRKVVCRTCWYDLPEYNNDFIEKYLPRLYGKLYILYRYDSNAGQLIHLLKYQRRFSLAEYFAHAVVTRFPNVASENYQYLIPVPLHKTHKRERGYNQCELVCGELSSLTGIPLNKDILSRIRNTKSQTNLNRKQRQENVMNAFSCLVPVINKKILLMDDVITTGSTLNACTLALLNAGAIKVDVIVLSG